MRSGRSVSRPKYRISCGAPSSITLKSLLLEIGDEVAMAIHHGGDQVDEAGGRSDRRSLGIALRLFRRWLGRCGRRILRLLGFCSDCEAGPLAADGARRTFAGRA